MVGTVEEHEVEGLEAQTTYFFAVRAVDEWGNPGPIGSVVGRKDPSPTDLRLHAQLLRRRIVHGPEWRRKS